KVQYRQLFLERTTKQLFDLVIEFHLRLDNVQAGGDAFAIEHVTQFLQHIYLLHFAANDNEFLVRAAFKQFSRQTALPDPCRPTNQQAVRITNSKSTPCTLKAFVDRRL